MNSFKEKLSDYTEEERKQLAKKLKDQKYLKEMYEKVFIEFDADNSGLLDKDEFSKFYKRYVNLLEIPELTDDFFTELNFDSADANKDGKISKEEFYKIIVSYFNNIKDCL